MNAVTLLKSAGTANQDQRFTQSTANRESHLNADDISVSELNVQHIYCATVNSLVTIASTVTSNKT